MQQGHSPSVQVRGEGTELPDAFGALSAGEQWRSKGKIQAIPIPQQALFQGCMTASRSLSALFPSSSKCRFPRERLEICTMKSAQPKHLQRLQYHHAPPLSALPVQGQHVFSHRHTIQPSPRDGEVTPSRETTLLGFLDHADTTEGGRANCCLYWEKAFNKGDGTIPSHRIEQGVEGGEGQLGRRAIGKWIFLLCTAT